MKYLLVAVMALFSVSVMAQGFEYWPKSDTRARGLAYYKNKNYAPGQRCVAIIHGIDERGPEDFYGLRKVATWGGWANIIAMADRYGFNIIWTQSNTDNSTDEIDYALKMAVDDLKADSNKLHLLGYSWGGRRIRIWTSRLTAKCLVKSVMRISSGGTEADDWTAIVRESIPTWLLHAVDDGRTSYKNSLVTFENAKKLDPNAPVYYTQYIAGLDLIYKGHNMLKYVGDWQIAVPSRATQTPGYTYNSSLNLIQWWEMNEWKRPTAPTERYLSRPIEPVPAPIPEPPAPKIKDTIYLFDNGTYIVRPAA